MDSSLYKVISIGVAAENKPLSTDILEVVPIEKLSYLNGEVDRSMVTIESTGVDSQGKSYSSNVNSSFTLTTRWMKAGSNRSTPPDIRRGEKVQVMRYADTDEYYWVALGDDDNLRKLETVGFQISGTSDEEEKELSKDNSYHVEMSSHKKVISITTSKKNGEKVAFHVEINPGEGIWGIKDDVGNFFQCDSLEEQMLYQNKTGSFIEVIKDTINVNAKNAMNFEAGKTMTFKAPEINKESTTYTNKSTTYTNTSTTYNVSFTNGELSGSGFNGSFTNMNLSGSGSAVISSSLIDLAGVTTTRLLQTGGVMTGGLGGGGYVGGGGGSGGGGSGSGGGSGGGSTIPADNSAPLEISSPTTFKKKADFEDDAKMEKSLEVVDKVTSKTVESETSKFDNVTVSNKLTSKDIDATDIKTTNIVATNVDASEIVTDKLSAQEALLLLLSSTTKIMVKDIEISNTIKHKDKDIGQDHVHEIDAADPTVTKVVK